MSAPVHAVAYVCNTGNCAPLGVAMYLTKSLGCHGASLTLLICIGIQALLPHGVQIDHVVAVPQILLGNLHLGHHIGLFHLTEQRAERLTRLEINRTVLDLNYDVVAELAVQRLELLNGLLGAVR